MTEKTSERLLLHAGIAKLLWEPQCAMQGSGCNSKQERGAMYQQQCLSATTTTTYNKSREQKTNKQTWLNSKQCTYTHQY